MFKKFYKFLNLFFILSLSLATHSFEQVIKLDLNKGDIYNYKAFVDQAKSDTKLSKIIFEFYKSNDESRYFLKTAEKISFTDIYKKNYPNGDFYYLIGDLDDTWTSSDYARYYSVAKWLANNGFRTIINVTAYVPDLEEAISNPNTTALIWNSHAISDGTIRDTNKVNIDNDIFIKLRTPNLKFVLFANCYGARTARKYGLNSMNKLSVLGWDQTVTSDDLFNYLFSTDFDKTLKEAFGNALGFRTTEKIEI